MDKPNIKFKNGEGRLSSSGVIYDIQKNASTLSRDIPKKERIKKSQLKTRVIFYSINITILVILAIFLITRRGKHRPYAL